MRKRVAEACRDGIDATMGACVTEAKRNVPVRTATLQGSIRFDPAEIKGSEVSGVWGSFDVNYALAVETGNRSLVGPPGSSSRERGPSEAQGATPAIPDSCAGRRTRNTPNWPAGLTGS